MSGRHAGGNADRYRYHPGQRGHGLFAAVSVEDFEECADSTTKKTNQQHAIDKVRHHNLPQRALT